MFPSIAIPTTRNTRFDSPDLIDDFSINWTDSSLESSPLSASPVFTSFPPLSAYAPLGRSPGIYGGTEDLPLLERDFCRNFTCCGHTLTDMHELVSHFEDAHVVALNADGKPLPPDLTSDDASDLSSSAPVTPPPSTPAFDHDELATPSAFSTFHPRLYRSSKYCFDPPGTLSVERAHLTLRGFRVHSQPGSAGGSDFDDDMMEVDSDYSPEPVCLSPTLLSVASREDAGQPHASEVVAATSPAPEADPQQETAGHHSPAPPKPITKKPSLDKAERAVDHKPITWAHQSHSPGRKPKSSQGSGSRRQKAFKAYKCPEPGCLKAYLNPNGLKYHIKKGTCDFGDRETSASSPSSEEK